MPQGGPLARHSAAVPFELQDAASSGPAASIRVNDRSMDWYPLPRVGPISGDITRSAESAQPLTLLEAWLPTGAVVTAIGDLSASAGGFVLQSGVVSELPARDLAEVALERAMRARRWGRLALATAAVLFLWSAAQSILAIRRRRHHRRLIREVRPRTHTA